MRKAWFSGFISGLTIGILILTGYRLEQRANQWHEYLCADGTLCDLEAKFYDIDWEARQDQINMFRSCHALFVQEEAEDFKQFMARIPKGPTPHKCVIYKKAQQALGPGGLFPAGLQDVTLTGGNFKGEAR